MVLAKFYTQSNWCLSDTLSAERTVYQTFEMSYEKVDVNLKLSDKLNYTAILLLAVIDCWSGG